MKDEQMDIWDRFAMAALTGFLAGGKYNEMLIKFETRRLVHQEIAQRAYEMAEAMVAARRETRE